MQNWSTRPQVAAEYLKVATYNIPGAGGTMIVHVSLTTVTSRGAGGTVVVHVSLTTATSRGAGGTVAVHVSLTTVSSRGAGGTMAVHVSLTTVIRVRFRLRAVIWLKLPWSHVRRVLSSLTLPNITGFLQVLRFPPVVTLDPWGVALTRPLGRIAQVADRFIQYK